MTLTPALIEAFAPNGVLRASINLGNPILARRDALSGEPVGVSIDLARAFGQRLGVPVELVVFDAAGKSVDAVVNDRADLGFFAIDPVRGAEIAFTAPYVLIEGAYLVRAESAITHNAQVDAAGVRVVVGKGSAYDLFLTRELKQARIVRAPTSPSVVDVFVEEALDVAAGVKQQLEADAAKRPGLRLLPGRFMIIRQAMGTPKRKGPQAAAALAAFVEAVKRSGFVAEPCGGTTSRALRWRPKGNEHEPWHHPDMGQGFGSESPRAHAQTAHRRPARFLVVIDSGGFVVARLFLDGREQVAEFDAATEEATQMSAGLVPTRGASGPEWDRALDGHSAAERAAAEVYTLDV